MIENRRPAIVVVNRKSGETMIIDITIPGDYTVKEKQRKYMCIKTLK